MIRKPSRGIARERRHERIRKHISGTAQKPRLAVFRSNSHMYAQLIDDDASRTICAASTVDKELKGKLEATWGMEAAKVVGELIAKRAVEKGVKEVVFDRGGFIYHGKIKALADAAREAGLQF